MKMSKQTTKGVPDQEGRILRSRREGAIVPGSLLSSSNDGLPTVCTVGTVSELASAKGKSGKAPAFTIRVASPPKKKPVMELRLGEMSGGTAEPEWGSSSHYLLRILLAQG